MARCADSFMTSPNWPVSVSWPSPSIRLASTNMISPPSGVQARPIATPGRVRRSDTYKHTHSCIRHSNCKSDCIEICALYLIHLCQGTRIAYIHTTASLLEQLKKKKKTYVLSLTLHLHSLQLLFLKHFSIYLITLGNVFQYLESIIISNTSYHWMCFWNILIEESHAVNIRPL